MLQHVTTNTWWIIAWQIKWQHISLFVAKMHLAAQLGNMRIALRIWLESTRLSCPPSSWQHETEICSCWPMIRRQLADGWSWLLAAPIMSFSEGERDTLKISRVQVAAGDFIGEPLVACDPWPWKMWMDKPISGWIYGCGWSYPSCEHERVANIKPRIHWVPQNSSFVAAARFPHLDKLPPWQNGCPVPRDAFPQKYSTPTEHAHLRPLIVDESDHCFFRKFRHLSSWIISYYYPLRNFRPRGHPGTTHPCGLIDSDTTCYCQGARSKVDDCLVASSADFQRLEGPPVLLAICWWTQLGVTSCYGGYIYIYITS